ncbi:hypothetical protein ABW19_dt0209707 [Dactylella cylindrospora]|nr:hypothetical protein ABW19_dt0209707 [Dactylella cylindrospora]
MLKEAIEKLNEAIEKHPWAGELAGVLPLTGFIDFVATPEKLHIFQLFGAVPLWSWPVTPQDFRLLISNTDTESDTICILDRFGNSLRWDALDGRYGDCYPLINPETVRLCLSSQGTTKIKNEHANMAMNDRVQELNIVHIYRVARDKQETRIPANDWSRFLLKDASWMFSRWYLATSTLGWVLLIILAVFCGLFEYYIALSFLLVTPAIGTVIFIMYGSRPRVLLEAKRAPANPLLTEEKLLGPIPAYNRLVVVAEHMNATDWTVFYGESTMVNALLNKKLQTTRSGLGRRSRAVLRMALRILTLGQWALIIASVCLKDFNAYITALWIITCVFWQAYIHPPELAAGEWMRTVGGFKMKRYRTRVSSRRALLNTIIALNPDSIAWSREKQGDDWSKFYEGGMKWIDPILGRSPDRTLWEEATLKAMEEVSDMSEADKAATNGENVQSNLSAAWDEKYRDEHNSPYYWRRFIPEGIYLAAKIKKEAGLSGRTVTW